MISAADIKILVASGEGYNAEFKTMVPSKVKELSEEICAFANAAGGVLLIGVDDQNSIIGVAIDNAKRSAIQNSMREITPHLNCEFSLVEIDGKTIGVIEVPSGPHKPYVLSGAIYVRIGPNSQKLTTAEQMRDFFQQSEKIYFDEGLCKDFLLQDIDETFLNSFKMTAELSAHVPNQQIFTNFKLWANGQIFKNGTVLFFGQEPDKFIEKAVVRCIAFEGTDKRFIIDDKVFGGPLFAQYQKAMHWLKGKLDVRYDIEGQGSGPRKEIWEIPEIVFKEAVINSLSHRDYYDKGAVITIEVFADRVEISNPGGLVSAITPADFGKRSLSRNPLIFGLFARMKLVEQIGSGIIRMRELMIQSGLPEPEYSTTGMFTVTLRRARKFRNKEAQKPSEKKTGTISEKPFNRLDITEDISVNEIAEKTSEKILRLIRENPAVTIEELASILERTPRAIEMQLHNLRKNKKIIRVGSDKGGFWKIIEKK